ncbi:MAG: hypothetical protein HBSAPP03_09990 [Phycisphaerae bacterium]|nr:MAG: hypothetical protein HBSAPP03_09990 [Phycisphaerae bacterium]
MDSLGYKNTANAAPWPVSGGEAAWAALRDDVGAFVALLSRAGGFVHTGPGVADVLGGSHAFPPGVTFETLFGPDFAAERSAAITRACAGEKPVRLLSMINGVLLTESYRALGTLRADAAVLWTARPVSLEGDFPAFAAPEREVARVHHLGPLATLTERELELLHHIGMGRTSDETAKLMHRSTRTVEWHRASLGQKLRCENRVQLARIAVRAGLSAVDIEFIRAVYHASPKPKA